MCAIRTRLAYAQLFDPLSAPEELPISNYPLVTCTMQWHTQLACFLKLQLAYNNQSSIESVCCVFLFLCCC
jgi:hypothetical protein